MIVAHTASHYPETLSYSDAEITARYEQSPEDFDVVSFYLYSAKASDYAETNEDGTTAEPTEENKATAKAAAEAEAAAKAAAEAAEAPAEEAAPAEA